MPCWYLLGPLSWALVLEPLYDRKAFLVLMQSGEVANWESRLSSGPCFAVLVVQTSTLFIYP